MCDRYSTPGDEDHPELEDEFLCEYVDGTMDPVIREVFEEYVRANPELREHIDCLRSTRLLLCSYGCRCHAPNDLHDRLRREISCDLIDGRMPFHVEASDRLRGAATFSTAMALVLFLGVIGGFSVVETGEQPAAAYVGAAVVGADARAAQPGARSVTLIENAPLSPRYSAIGGTAFGRRFGSTHQHVTPGTNPDTSAAAQLAALQTSP